MSERWTILFTKNFLFHTWIKLNNIADSSNVTKFIDGPHSVPKSPPTPSGHIPVYCSEMWNVEKVASLTLLSAHSQPMGILGTKEKVKDDHQFFKMKS